MKCPKCGYISFDFNQVCPKCNKEISSEQAMLNLPSFRPDPPFLLGTLIGDADISGVVLQAGGSPADMGAAVEMDMDLEETRDIETGGMTLDEGEDLEIGLEPEDSEELEIHDFEQAGEGDKTSLESDEIPAFSGTGEEEITLDLDDLSLVEPEKEISISEEAQQDDVEPEISLEETSFDDSGAPEEMVVEEETGESEKSLFDLGPIEMEGDGDIGDSEPPEIEIDLNDLQMDDAGTGDISVPMEPSEEKARFVEDLVLDKSESEGEEETIDLADFSLDESPGEESDGVLDLGDISLDESLPEEPGEALELGDLSLEEPAEPDQDQDIEDFLELGEVSLDETDSEDIGDALELDDGVSMSGQDLEALILDEEEQEPLPQSLDNSGEHKDDNKVDDTPMLDLENLDLDLDLDEPEDKAE